MLSEKDSRKVKQEIENSNALISKNKSLLNQFKKTFSKKEINLLNYIQLSMELRDKRKEIIQKLVVLLVDALRQLASRHWLSYHNISFVHKSELEKIGDKTFHDEIRQRVKIGAIQLATPEGSKVQQGIYEEAREKINQIILGSTNELKGIVAREGKVQGVVKIVLGEKDFPSFNKGDILVTSMTRPEFVPLMRKASAVITDEGGVTCHAAIISRELGLPCIIGTRTATLFLKTGDLVEVDANKGIVKVLNKNATQQPFVKAYTRNFSIIMREAWFAANKENLIEKLDLKEYPYEPPYIYYMKDGVEEVWENTKANRWILDRIVKKLNSDSKFFPELYKRYFDRLSEIEKLWKKDISKIQDLEKFIGQVYEGVSDSVIIYSALMDDRIPKNTKSLLINLEKKMYSLLNAMLQ